VRARIFLNESGKRINGNAIAATTSFPTNPTGTGRITLTASKSPNSTTVRTQTNTTPVTSDIPQSSNPAASSNTAAGAGAGTNESTTAKNTGLKVRLGIGVPLAIIATAAAVYFCLKKCKDAKPHVSGLDAGNYSYRVSEVVLPYADNVPPLLLKEEYYASDGLYSSKLSAPSALAELRLLAVVEIDFGGMEMRRSELGG
jgi:hypothetical protein